MSGEVLKKFGKYFLLDMIAQGGMAEIYRARLAAKDGAGRLIVIKRIQAGYGANAEFLQMFKSEIKVTMGFNHPNIVQLYDFGDEQNQPYIAMELVDGKNLRQFLNRFREIKESFPVELAAYIIEQSASGLHYAHSFRDKITGEPLHVVHRDISPQNILISYEGNVKVIDFGIAKATTNSEATRAGVIKGKPSYLSPEQIGGDPLDGRSDIFALGAVLWELLTGQKLFAGESDLAVLKLIEACSTSVKPPSTLNPKVPKELDYIVLKMLAKQREKRYHSADELQRALHRFLYSFNPDFNPTDLASYAKELFKDEIVKDRKRIQQLNDKVEQLLKTDILPEAESANSVATSSDDPPKMKEDSTVVSRLREREQTYTDLASNKDLKVEIDPYSAHRAQIAMNPGPGSRVQASGLIRQSAQSASRARERQQSHAAERTKGGGGFFKFVAALAAVATAVALYGPEMGIDLKALGLDLSFKREPAAVPSKTAPDIPKSAVKAGASEKTILLRLELNPGGVGMNVTVNGKPVDAKNPLITVPLDQSLELNAEYPGFRPLQREFVLESAQYAGQRETRMEVQLEPLRFGYLTIRTTPSADATIMLDGKAWLKKTPIENEKMPAGNYTIRLSNDVLGMEKSVSVTVQEGKSVNVDERLEIRR